MEERTRWKLLIPIDLPPPLVESGKDSKEKDIQYAREKGILQALYFNRSMYELCNAISIILEYIKYINFAQFLCIFLPYFLFVENSAYDLNPKPKFLCLD